MVLKIQPCAGEPRRAQSSQYVLNFLHYLYSSSTVVELHLLRINVLFEIGHARAKRGRMFTWPSSVHSQVPLAHITLRYSCHQALASGAERVRDTEQRQRDSQRETDGNERDKRTETKQRGRKRGKCVDVCRNPDPFLFDFPLNFQQAAAERSSTAGPRRLRFLSLAWKRASATTSLCAPSESRSQSLALAWKPRPHAESTSAATH